MQAALEVDFLTAYRSGRKARRAGETTRPYLPLTDYRVYTSPEYAPLYSMDTLTALYELQPVAAPILHPYRLVDEYGYITLVHGDISTARAVLASRPDLRLAEVRLVD